MPRRDATGSGIVLAAALAIGLFSWGGCASHETGGLASPEAVGAAFVDALHGRSVDAAAALFPDEALVSAAYRCGGATPPLLVAAAYRARLPRLVSAIRDGVSFAWTGIVEGSAVREQVAAGATTGHCTVERATTFLRVEVAFQVTDGGATGEQRLPLDLIQVGEGGPWFLAGYELCPLAFCVGQQTPPVSWLERLD